MLDRDHPLIRRLLDGGYRVVGHVYLSSQGVKCEVAAYDGQRTFKGRSRGDLAEAMRDLGREASAAAGAGGR